MPRFADHFSQGSAGYAANRPRYPAALFDYLAGLVPGARRALDLAAGSGQASVGLAAVLPVVVATEASVAQLAAAFAAPRVGYAAGLAEEIPLPAASVELVTIAQALHWLDLHRLWPEVVRVLLPGGVVAIWCYDLLRVGPRVDAELDHLYRDVVGAYWPPERRILETGYRELAFPFRELATPAFAMSATWSYEDLRRYLGTWSATRRCQQATGADPIAGVDAALRSAWERDHPGPAEAAREVRFPLSLRVGRRI